MQRCISFVRPGLKQPWLVTHVETIDGEEFIKLSMKDSGFSRFVSGSCRGCKSMKWLDDLRKQRLLETLKLSVDTESIFDTQPTTASARVKQKKECELKLKSGSLPRTVVINMPSVEYNGHVEPARSIKVVSAVDLGTAIQIECSAANLQYVRVAMLASHGDRTRTIRERGSGSVRYIEDRNVFLARRTEGGKYKTKAFTVKKHSGDENITKDKAQRWAANMDDGDDDEADGDDSDAEERDEDECDDDDRRGEERDEGDRHGEEGDEDDQGSSMS